MMIDCRRGEHISDKSLGCYNISIASFASLPSSIYPVTHFSITNALSRSAYRQSTLRGNDMTTLFSSCHIYTFLASNVRSLLASIPLLASSIRHLVAFSPIVFYNPRRVITRREHALLIPIPVPSIHTYIELTPRMRADFVLIPTPCTGLMARKREKGSWICV